MKFLTIFLLLISMLFANSLDDDEEFQRMLQEARKSNQAKDKAREEARKKETAARKKAKEEARKKALLEMKKKEGSIRYINLTGEPVERKSIDYIDIGSARLHKGYLELYITYHSRESGTQVFWRDGKAKLNCKAYAHNGTLLGVIENREVHSSGQAFYIDTTLHGTLKCNLDFYGKFFHESTNF